MSDEFDITLYGEELTVELAAFRSGGKRVVDVTHADGRKWRLVVKSTGTLDHVETTWRDGQLADLDQPDWSDDLLARMAQPA